jgi:hypothetical protein
MWQSWNALTGLWYDTLGTLGSGQSINTAITLAAFEGLYPNATLDRL